MWFHTRTKPFYIRNINVNESYYYQRKYIPSIWNYVGLPENFIINSSLSTRFLWHCIRFIIIMWLIRWAFDRYDFNIHRIYFYLWWRKINNKYNEKCLISGDICIFVFSDETNIPFKKNVGGRKMALPPLVLWKIIYYSIHISKLFESYY